MVEKSYSLSGFRLQFSEELKETKWPFWFLNMRIRKDYREGPDFYQSFSAFSGTSQWAPKKSFYRCHTTNIATRKGKKEAKGEVWTKVSLSFSSSSFSMWCYRDKVQCHQHLWWKGRQKSSQKSLQRGDQCVCSAASLVETPSECGLTCRFGPRFICDLA